jgi:hypothetical protein
MPHGVRKMTPPLCSATSDLTFKGIISVLFADLRFACRPRNGAISLFEEILLLFRMVWRQRTEEPSVCIMKPPIIPCPTFAQFQKSVMPFTRRAELPAAGQTSRMLTVTLRLSPAALPLARLFFPFATCERPPVIVKSARYD